MTIRKIGDTNLFIGNSNDSRDIDTLRRLKIRNVVNVAKDLEGPWFHGEFRNYKIPLLDGEGNKPYHYILASQIVLLLLKAGENVLVHCQGGISRSPSIGVICLTVLYGGSPEKSFELVKSSRPSSNIREEHWYFIRKVTEYLIKNSISFDIERILKE